MRASVCLEGKPCVGDSVLRACVCVLRVGLFRVIVCVGEGKGKWVVGMFFVCVCVSMSVCILVRAYMRGINESFVCFPDVMEALA